MFCGRTHYAGLHWSSFTLETKQDLSCIKCFCFHLGPSCCTEYCLLVACGCYPSHSHLMALATELKESSLGYQCWAEIPSPSFAQHTPGTPQDEPGLGYKEQTVHIYQIALLFLATFLYSGEWLQMDTPADFPGHCCAPGTSSQEEKKRESKTNASKFFLHNSVKSWEPWNSPWVQLLWPYSAAFNNFCTRWWKIFSMIGWESLFPCLFLFLKLPG